MAVVIPVAVERFTALIDVRHIPQPHGNTVFPGHYRVAQLHRVYLLGIGVNPPAVRIILQFTDRLVWQRTADGISHRIKRNTFLLQQQRLNIHPDARRRAAVDCRAANAVNLCHLGLQNTVDQIIKLRLGHHIRGQGQHQNGRAVRIHLPEGWARGHAAGQQALRRIQRRLNIARHAVHIAADVKLNDDARNTLAAGRGQFINP